MNIDDISALARILDSNGLTSLEVSEGNLRVRLEKNPGVTVTRPVPHRDGDGARDVSEAPPGLAVTDIPANTGAEAVIVSPLVGVLYSSPSPDSEPFVSIGSRVKKGDVLCIVEAMKIMNEITAERDGEIADVCVKNGAVVEYGQTLFKFIPA